MRLLRNLFLTLLLLIAGLGLWAYSWTFTPEGRLDLPAAVLAKLSSFGPPLVLDTATAAEARLAANEQMGALLRLAPIPQEISITELEVPGPGGDIPVRVYRPPAEGALPALLWLHGGGFWMGNNLADWDALVASFAVEANVAIFSVDYRLAPEHPWPAAVDDAYAALQWLHRNAASMGVDGARLAVGGTSAGGNLSAVVALKARDEGGPRLSAQLLQVPATDGSVGSRYPSEELFAEGYLLNAADIATMIDAYLPNPRDRAHPYASPLLAASHRDLPPAVISTAQYDPLRDEGEAYGEKLRAAGVNVDIVRIDGAIHGFAGSMEGARTVRDAEIALLDRVFKR